MALNLTEQTEKEIEAKVRSGGYRSADEVIQEGLALIEAREAFRQAVAEGEAEFDRGEYVTAEESRRRVHAMPIVRTSWSSWPIVRTSWSS